MSRKTARENAFRLVYEFCVNGAANELTYRALCGNDSADDADFTATTVSGVLAHYETLKDCMTTYSRDFVFDRIYKIDLAVLLVASYEILYTSVPAAVAANEAIELCKVYSTDKSPSYVNGILSSVITNKIAILQAEEDRAKAKEEKKERVVQEEIDAVKESESKQEEQPIEVESIVAIDNGEEE